MVDRNVQEKHLGALVKNGGFQFTSSFFPYTSGEIGPYYVQSADVLKDGSDYAKAIDDMSELVRSSIIMDDYENFIVSGGETRDWMFSFPVAASLSLPHLMIYKDGKVLGPSIEGKYVIHVADLNNEGSSPRDKWVPTIRKSGGNISDIFFYVDRMEDGVKVMQDLGLNSHSLVPLDEHAWDYLRTQNVVSEEVYRNLMGRMEDKHDWAVRMLRSDVGIKKLREMVDDPKQRGKVEKIVNSGYPELKDELIERVPGIPNTSLFQPLK